MKEHCVSQYQLFKVTKMEQSLILFFNNSFWGKYAKFDNLNGFSQWKRLEILFGDLLRIQIQPILVTFLHKNPKHGLCLFGVWSNFYQKTKLVKKSISFHLNQNQGSLRIFIFATKIGPNTKEHHPIQCPSSRQPGSFSSTSSMK